MTATNQSCESNLLQDRREMRDAEIRDTLDHIKHKILVMSGKGGVGKSSVTAYLSVIVAERRHKVGQMAFTREFNKMVDQVVELTA